MISDGQRLVDTFNAAQPNGTLSEVLGQFKPDPVDTDEVDDTYRFYHFADGSKVGSYVDNRPDIWVVRQL